MYKNLKYSFLLTFILTVVVIAWRTLTNFFHGVGFNYVALLVVVALLLSIFIFDKETRSRMKDLFIVSCVFAGLETIVYFPFEFGACANYNVAVVFNNFQNVYSFLAILFLAYLAFRFITETQNVRIRFVEILLGNEKRSSEKKVKKAKYNDHSGLEEKPNSQNIVKDENLSSEE